jgi:hypothetical protein
MACRLRWRSVLVLEWTRFCMQDRPCRCLSQGWSSILALFTPITFLTSTVAPLWGMNSLRAGALPLSPIIGRNWRSATRPWTRSRTASTPAMASLGSGKPAKAVLPANVTVPPDASSVTFNIDTTKISRRINAPISASYGGVMKSVALMVVRR